MFVRHRLTAVCVVFLLCVSPARAEDLTVENVQWIHDAETGVPMHALMDVKWQHAWHTARNHDAAWIFLKFVFEDGGYMHALLAPEGHTVVSGAPADPQLNVAEDGTGFWLFPRQPHRGPVHWRLRILLSESIDTNRLRGAQLQAYGVEMVYIPAGPFTLGDPDTTALAFGAFYKSDANGQPDGLVRIEDERAFDVGPAAGQVYYRNGDNEYEGDQQGPVPAAFPKGTRAFYLMKYELTQGQYAAFLNTLRDEATFTRFSFGGRSYARHRGSIHLDGGRYTATHPDRALNFAHWDDQLAFADWAALRPMTELEFTKAARGPEAPRAGAFPWGTASRDRLARVMGPDGDLIMTHPLTQGDLTDENRDVFGASYYWVMDLAGSVWERVISIGRADGRTFEGTHGDGTVNGYGEATNADWPHTHAGAEGHGYRGGGYYNQGMRFHAFNPYSPVAYRRYGGWAGPKPSVAYGFRAARTAEP